MAGRGEKGVDRSFLRCRVVLHRRNERRLAMRITILNGEPDPGSAFQAYVRAVAGHLAGAGHEVTTFDLRELRLKGCRGCWGCWVRTPGECVQGDDSAQLCRAAVASGLVVLASPVAMGFTSALLKGAVD